MADQIPQDHLEIETESDKKALQTGSDAAGDISIISDFTVEFLIKARDLSRRDPSAARVIFGISSEMIEAIANMDIDQIRRVAASGLVCFEPRLTPEFAAKLAALKAPDMGKN